MSFMIFGFLSDEGPMLETLDFISPHISICISTSAYSTQHLFVIIFAQ